MSRPIGFEVATRGVLPEHKAIMTNEARRAGGAAALARTPDEAKVLQAEGTARAHAQSIARLRHAESAHPDSADLTAAIATREADPTARELRANLDAYATLTERIDDAHAER